MVLVVCSLARKYNISINTGNNTLCLTKDDDDDGDDDDDDDDDSVDGILVNIKEASRLADRVMYYYRHRNCMLVLTT